MHWSGRIDALAALHPGNDTRYALRATQIRYSCVTEHKGFVRLLEIERRILHRLVRSLQFIRLT